MPELLPGTNTGFLIRPPRAGAWLTDGETGIAKEILEPSGQFDVYLPDEEAQATFNPFLFDTSACVTFSGTNDLETLLTRLRSKTQLPTTHEAFLLNSGYINKQSGKINFSDRFSAKMSGTTKKGNYLEAVGDSFRRDGLLPESDWAFPDMSDVQNDGEAKWQRYYAEISSELKDKARKFLDYFDINYQWVIVGTSDNNKLRENLQYGPVQIASSVCPPWNSNDGQPPIPSCGCGAQHATLIYGYRTDLALKDFDHYKSYRKLLAPDYCIQWGFQYTLKAKALVLIPAFHYIFKINLAFGMPDTPEVRNLQRALQTVKRADGTPYMKAGVFGPYGPTTRNAVALFQADKGISTTDGGVHFGPKTRTVMNALLV